MTEVNVESENIIKLESVIKEEPQEADIEDTYEEVHPNNAEGSNSSAVDWLLSTPQEDVEMDSESANSSTTEDDQEEEIKLPFAIFLASDVEYQEEEEEEEHENVECEQDPLFVVENVVIKKENISVCVKDETVCNLDVGYIGDVVQCEGDATIVEPIRPCEPIETKQRSPLKGFYPEGKAEHYRRLPVAPEGPITRGAACQRTLAAKAHVSDHTYARSAEKLCQCEVCRMGFEPMTLASGPANGAKPKERCVIKRRPRKSVCEAIDSRSAREGPFTCPICRRRYQIKIHFTRHMLVHRYGEERKPKGRGVIEKKSKKGADDRLRSQKEGKPFECAICKMGFRLKGYLTQHMKVHRKIEEREESNDRSLIENLSKEDDVHCSPQTTAGSFYCGVCKNTFKLIGHLTKHICVDERRKKAIACTISNKTSRKNLTGHPPFSIKARSKPFGCNICRKTFAASVQLSGHMRIHPKYECNICKLTFHNREYHSTHLRSHVEEANECVVCEEMFDSSEHLSLHMDIRHPKLNRPILSQLFSLMHERSKRENKCAVCKQPFKSSLLLSQHMRSHMKKISEYAECNEHFDAKELYRCLSSHEEKVDDCNICKYTFYDADTFYRHKRTHRKRRYECCMSEHNSSTFAQLSEHAGT